MSRPANQVSAMYRPARDLGYTLGIAALFAAAAWLGIALKREVGPVAAIWPSNGLLAAILLLRSQADWRWTLAACFVANIAVNVLAGNTADTARRCHFRVSIASTTANDRLEAKLAPGAKAQARPGNIKRRLVFLGTVK